MTTGEATGGRVVGGDLGGDALTHPAAPARRIRRPGGGPLGVVRAMASRPSGAIGLALVGFHVLLALTAPLLTPYDHTAQNADLILQAPSGAHPMGADNLGRDVLSRTMMGGQVAMLVTAAAAVLATLWGGLAGILVGLVGGRLDEIVMRLVDAFLSIPWLLFLLLIVSVVGGGVLAIIPTLGFFYGVAVMRVARGAALDVVARDFVTAARVRGERRWTIVRREILPNVLDILLVEGAMRWSWMLLAFSSLSFLGFGVTPPTPDWGLMIADARGIITVAPWAALWPAAALSTLIIGINLTADSLGKALGIDRARRMPT